MSNTSGIPNKINKTQCGSRLAGCNIIKMTGFSNGVVINHRATRAQRMTDLIKVQSRMRNVNWVRENVKVNEYGQRSGGPNGYGQSPKNTF